jgi:ElaB/YqjD/DUF883 family membrane-anchored ribosome-binding protein
VNQTFEDAEVKKVSKNIQETLERSKKILAADEWIQIRSNINSASKELNSVIKQSGKTVIRIDESLKKHDKRLSASLENFQKAAENANNLLKSGNMLVIDAQSRVSNIDKQLIETLSSLNTAGKNINNLIQQLMDQPSMLLFSSPPPAKQIDPTDR